jgi:hypothetical protein
VAILDTPRALTQTKNTIESAEWIKVLDRSQRDTAKWEPPEVIGRIGE